MSYSYGLADARSNYSRRRHSCVDRTMLSTEVRYEEICTPSARRRHSIVDESLLVRAPLKQERSHSLTAGSSTCKCTTLGVKGKCQLCLNHIRKRLVFPSSGFGEMKRPLMTSPLYSILHQEDVAVPFSELDLHSFPHPKSKRVKFEDELEGKLDLPETPVWNSSLRITSDHSKLSDNTEALFSTLGGLPQLNVKGRRINFGMAGNSKSESINHSATPLSATRNINWLMQ